MSMTLAQVLELALKLPEHQRVELAQAMLISLDGEDDADLEEIERLWIEEAKRRSDEVARGEAQTIPGDEVFARLRERYG